MPNNETFQIHKFQMKICDEWGQQQQNYEPEEGEPIYITATIGAIAPPIFVIGNGINTLSWLVSQGRYYTYKQPIPQPGNRVELTTTDGTASAGTTYAWARSDHKHTLDKKITSGTSLPANANNGDIFILIEANV